MTITVEKTWETKPVVVYEDVGSYYVQERNLVWGIKNALLQMTIPAIVRLSSDKTTSSNDPQKTVTGATQADPCEITIASHGFATGERVRLESIGGMTELDDTDYTITVTGTNTFTLDDIDSTLFTTYTSGGVCWYQDNQDLWVDADDVWYGTSTHSWIVLEFPGVSPNGKFQVLFDYDVDYVYRMYIYVSESGSFFGGTTSVRPTASDEGLVGNNVAWATSSSAASRTAYICQSTDGQVVRIHTSYARTQYSFWMFERVKDPVSGWTKPVISCCIGGANTPYESQIFDADNIHAMNNLADPTEWGTFRGSTLTFNTASPVRESLGGQGRDFNGEYYAQTIGLVRNVAGSAGRMGEMFDFWMMTTDGTQWNYLLEESPWSLVKVGDGFIQPAEEDVPWWRV